MINEKLLFIENELKKFNVTDSAISELTEKYMHLKINNFDDKEGYKIVKNARIVMKNYRVDIDKKRKELTSDALEYQRRINSEAKRIIALLEPIENHLFLMEEAYEKEQEKQKLIKEQAEEAKIQIRIQQMIELDFKFNGVLYVTEYMDTFNDEKIQLTPKFIKIMDDETFDAFIRNAKEYHASHLQYLSEQEQIKKDAAAKEEAQIKAEKERLSQQQKEQENERHRLNEIAREQAKKESALKAEEYRIENEKRKHEEHKRLEAESAERRNREIADEIERENKKIEHEKNEKLRQELLLPDKEKLINFLQKTKNILIYTIIIPDLNSSEAEFIISNFQSKINNIIIELEKNINFFPDFYEVE